MHESREEVFHGASSGPPAPRSAGPLPPDTIRLLRIDLDDKDAPISGHLVSTKLSAEDKDRPPYFAVSYVRSHASSANAASTRTILVDDTPVQIPASAYELLHAIRIFQHANRRFVPDHVWIDAVCTLPQDGNRALRTAAVFAHSARCIVWLGPDENWECTNAQDNDNPEKLSSDLVLLRWLHNICRHDGYDRGNDEEQRPPEAWFDRFMEPPETRDMAWDAVERLFRHPWFTELGDLQEALLTTPLRTAPSFWCGHRGVLSYYALWIGQLGLEVWLKRRDREWEDSPGWWSMRSLRLLT